MPDQNPSPSEALVQRISEKKAPVAFLGLGTAGLPECVEIAFAGFPVIGLDVSASRITQIERHELDAPDDLVEKLRQGLESGRLSVSTDFSRILDAVVVVICVPTPVHPDGIPNMGYVETAVDTVLSHLNTPKLVLLESTCSPGTTRRLALPRLSQKGAMVGRDFFLAHCPERVDPGNKVYGIKNTPRVLGGITESCTHLALAFYTQFVDTAKVVSCPEVAETAKLVENIYRLVNIGFVNEMCILANALGVSIWEVLDAAASKSFGYTRFNPGPGVGGSCIPVAPYYLLQEAKKHRIQTPLVDAAIGINASMPEFTVQKLERLLASRGHTLRGARVLLLGITYKPDVADTRGSPALEVFALLRARGVDVMFNDPLVPRTSLDGTTIQSSHLDEALLEGADCVLLLSPHSSFDYELITQKARLILDARGALAPYGLPHIVPL